MSFFLFVMKCCLINNQYSNIVKSYLSLFNEGDAAKDFFSLISSKNFMQARKIDLHVYHLSESLEIALTRRSVTRVAVMQAQVDGSI